MDCFGTYCTRVQTCGNVRVQSATQRTALVHTAHMSKPVVTFVFKLLRNGSKCYGMGCFGAYCTHVKTCENVRVQRATEWTSSVHTAHVSKHVVAFVFKVLRNGLLQYITLYYYNLQSTTSYYIQRNTAYYYVMSLYVQLRTNYVI